MQAVPCVSQAGMQAPWHREVLVEWPEEMFSLDLEAEE